MENSTLPVWLASVGISFAAGFGMAMYVQEPAPGAPALPVAVAAQAPPASRAANMNQFADMWGKPGPPPGPSVSALPKSASVDELWARALAPQDSQQPGYDAEDRLRKLVQSDPTALRKVLQHYDSATTPQARELLKSVLSTVQTPEVIAFSTRLASSSNVEDRKYGFEMLQSLAPESPEVRSLVKQTLATEQSPEVLVQALMTLRAGASDPDESDQVVTQLKSLSQHADPAVRSQSIAQLGQWDKKGEGEDHLSQALADRAPEVRQAAIFAIAQTGLRSDTLKAALMGLITNPQESRDVRGSALQVLERFSLNKEEYARFAQARAQIQGS